jgi:hypothetical protein
VGAELGRTAPKSVGDKGGTSVAAVEGAATTAAAASKSGGGGGGGGGKRTGGGGAAAEGGGDTGAERTHAQGRRVRPRAMADNDPTADKGNRGSQCTFGRAASGDCSGIGGEHLPRRRLPSGRATSVSS